MKGGFIQSFSRRDCSRVGNWSCVRTLLTKFFCHFISLLACGLSSKKAHHGISDRESGTFQAPCCVEFPTPRSLEIKWKGTRRGSRRKWNASALIHIFLKPMIIWNVLYLLRESSMTFRVVCWHVYLKVMLRKYSLFQASPHDAKNQHNRSKKERKREH